MTKILINTDLDDALIQRIQDISEEVEIITASSEGEALEIMPEVEVVLGPVTPAMLALGDHLRWVQNLGAGVDGVLFPEFVESDVVLTSAKGMAPTASVANKPHQWNLNNCNARSISSR